jgi:hypothetical protein
MCEPTVEPSHQGLTTIFFMDFQSLIIISLFKQFIKQILFCKNYL